MNTNILNLMVKQVNLKLEEMEVELRKIHKLLLNIIL